MIKLLITISADDPDGARDVALNRKLSGKSFFHLYCILVATIIGVSAVVISVYK
jgi:hypothetical protein